VTVWIQGAGQPLTTALGVLPTNHEGWRSSVSGPAEVVVETDVGFD
jgi:hypothetical protein